MTQEEFAVFCDVSRISIARYDAGDPISRTKAKKIAKACNVSIDSLYNFCSACDSSEAEPVSPAESITPEEEQILNDYRALTARGKRRASETLHELSILYGQKTRLEK